MNQLCLACESNMLYRSYPAVKDYEYGTYHEVDYLRCLTCGLVIQHPLPSHKNIHSFYPSHYRNHQQFRKRNFYSMLKQFQLQSLAGDIQNIIFNKNSSILEIGCGGGLLLLTLQQRGFRYLHGTDLSNAAEKFLTQNGIVFRKADIEKKFPFSQKFDLILLNHVIEHLFDPLSVLALCKQHLSEKGKVIVITPNSNSAAFNIFKRYCDGINAPRHLVIFSARAMEGVRRKLNFHRLIYYPVLDPMQWAISLQNVFQNVSFLRIRLKRGLAWYTIFLGILFAPFSLVTRFGRKSASMMCVFE